MKLENKGKQQIDEVPWGVYLWEMPGGKYVADDEGHFLMIASTRGDNVRMKALAAAARDCGVTEGMPCFFSGNRIVTDEEYEEQKLRMKFGLNPDPLDVAAIKEDRINARNRNK